MQYVVRAYIFDKDNNMVLVKMDDHAPRALPWGHVEAWENLYTALQREIREELGYEIRVIGSRNSFYESHIRGYPMPISIHEITYEHRSWKQVTKLEFWFFAELVSEGKPTQEKWEIVDQTRCSADEMLAMQAWNGIYRSIQEVYQQNMDLLEIVE